MFAALDLLVARGYQDGPEARALSQSTILTVDTGTGKLAIFIVVLRSKVAIVRLKVAPGDCMPRILESEYKAAH